MSFKDFELSSSVSMLIAFFLVIVLAILKGTCIRELPFMGAVGVISGLETLYLGKRLAQKSSKFNGG